MSRHRDHESVGTPAPPWRSRVFRGHLGPAWRDAHPDAVRRRLAGRTVLVTGASSGIGRATSRALGAAGAHVIGLSRRTDELTLLSGELGALGATSTMITCDLREPEQVSEALTVLADHDLDTVISNAGLSIRRTLAASGGRGHDLTRSVATNLVGPAQLITGLLPALRTRPQSQVINIGSVSAVVPTAGWSSYASTKAAFDAWLRAVAGELRGSRVTVTTIHLPLVLTAMSAPTYRTGWGLTVDQAASVVLAASVRRPRLLLPWWARIAGVVGLLAPGSVEAWPGERR